MHQTRRDPFPYSGDDSTAINSWNSIGGNASRMVYGLKRLNSFSIFMEKINDIIMATRMNTTIITNKNGTAGAK